MKNQIEILWEELRKAKENREDKGKAPIVEIDLDKKQAKLDPIMGFEHKMTNSHSTSKASSLKELPSFIDENGSDKEMLRVPSQYHPNPTVMDIANLQILMSTPVKVSMTLAKILKAKPELWQEVTTCLNNMGVPITEMDPIHTEEKVQRGVKCELIHVYHTGGPIPSRWAPAPGSARPVTRRASLSRRAATWARRSSTTRSRSSAGVRTPCTTGLQRSLTGCSHGRISTGWGTGSTGAWWSRLPRQTVWWVFFRVRVCAVLLEVLMVWYDRIAMTGRLGTSRTLRESAACHGPAL